MQPTVTIEGRRVYVRTQYGDPCVPALKSLGAHWDADSKRWWLTSAKESEVRAAIERSTDQPPAIEEITVSGKAQYKGRAYYIRWSGQTKSGEHKARLCTLDAKVDFWADVGDGTEEAAITKRYEKPRTLESIRRFIEEMRLPEAPDVERRICWECGRTFTYRECRQSGGDWADSYCGC